MLHNNDNHLDQLDACNHQNAETTYVPLLQEVSLCSYMHC